jgi:hypothetical protein
VAVRIRPLLASEAASQAVVSRLSEPLPELQALDDRGNENLQVYAEEGALVRSGSHALAASDAPGGGSGEERLKATVHKVFSFDAVLDERTTQARVFDHCQIASMLNAALDGYHATIFAYVPQRLWRGVCCCSL